MRPAHFAREILAGPGVVTWLPGFNEARAFCAGNLGLGGAGAGAVVASMRPAHFAREIRQQIPKAAEVQEASMRPAHFAREIVAVYGMAQWRDYASMRPAHFAREILGAVPVLEVSRLASMRPAHFAREIALLRQPLLELAVGFNEARAFCAGN